MSAGKYTAAYDLLREILADSELNTFVKEHTKKALSVIDSGPVVTTPAAGIFFKSSENDGNTIKAVRYTVIFSFPLFGSDCMRTTHEFLDVIDRAFLRKRAEIRDLTNFNPMVSFAPSAIGEEMGEKHTWNIAITATIVI